METEIDNEDPQYSTNNNYNQSSGGDNSEMTSSSSGIETEKQEQQQQRPETAASDITQLSPECLQRKLYFLVNQLKQMHSQLPEKYQIRISYELLMELANSLLNDTIFEIVKGLMEIQHVTEKHLKQLRDQVENEYQIEIQDWASKITDREELEHILALMKIKHTKNLRETDMKIIAHLDQKLIRP